MTNRILNEDGTYAVPEEVVEPEGVDPNSLPQQQPDEFATVDTGAFDHADTMTRKQMVTMAEVASFRGESQIALRWKMLAQENKLMEDRAADAARMADILSRDKYVGQPGQIIDTVSDLPWENDAAYVETRTQLDAAKAKLEATESYSADHPRLKVEVANLIEQLEDRKVAARQSALDAGVWTQSDDLALAARANLDAKATQVAKMMEGTHESA